MSFFTANSDVTHLIYLVEDSELPLILLLRRVLEIIDILTDDLTIGDEKSLAIDHVGDHHDLIGLLIWEFEWLLGCFDIISHNNRLSTLNEGGYPFEGECAGHGGNSVPQTDPDVCTDEHSLSCVKLSYRDL